MSESTGGISGNASTERLARLFDRRWIIFTILVWLGTATVMVILRWGMIQWMNMADMNDDTMRLLQVRALLNGQGWYDLRNHGLNPPFGANIHWSRLVDLPVAGLILIFKPLGTGVAERIACAVAPMLPLLPAMLGMGFIARRLVHTHAYLLALFLMLCAMVALTMFMPMRIDHHGWQLAFLVLTMGGMVDRRALRGGLVMGLTSAASLVIGLEMIPFLAIAGGSVVLRWIAAEEGATARMRAYGVALALGCLAGYGGFASFDNATMRCDALTPVWLTMMVLAGVISVGLSFVPAMKIQVRIVLTLLGGAVLAGVFIHYFPQCMGRPEQVSDELYRIWLSNVREAKPLLTQGVMTIGSTIALPLAGLIGALIAAARARGTAMFASWATIALFTLAAFALTLWQIRMGPATQLVAIPGAVAFAWISVPRAQSSGQMLVRVLGTVGIFLFVSGIGISSAAALWQMHGTNNSTTAKTYDMPRRQTLNPNTACMTLPTLSSLNRLPDATIFTHVDMSARLLLFTHHRAIAGPYHRNGDAILDVYHAFGGTPDQARAIMAQHGARYLLICPGMNETTVYHARFPGKFYDQLVQGQVPNWLTPVSLPATSPLKLWAITPAQSEIKPK